MTPGPSLALLIALTAMALAGCASKPPPAAPPASIKPPNSQLEHCPRALGTLSFQKDAEHSGTLPLLRMMVRASNCFILASNKASTRSEHQLTPSDYTATPSLHFGNHAAIGHIGSLNDLALQPSTLLTLTDNRSGAELAVAQGSASHWRFGAAGGFFNGGFAGADGYLRTAQEKALAAALMDSYNQVVRALKRHAALAASTGFRPAQVAQAARPDHPHSR